MELLKVVGYTLDRDQVVQGDRIRFWSEEKKAARQQLRDLRAQERKLERMLGKGKAA